MNILKTLLLLIILSLLTINQANCCDCNAVVGYDKAKIVFVGKVTKVINKGMYEITFRICRMEKGTVMSKKIIIYTPCLIDACCGIKFKKNEMYKIFAYCNYGKLYTDLCTETIRIK